MVQLRRFSAEYKREAVQLLESGGYPASKIARELGVLRNRLYSRIVRSCAYAYMEPANKYQGIS
jgi:transposase-like protein